VRVVNDGDLRSYGVRGQETCAQQGTPAKGRFPAFCSEVSGRL